MGSVRRARAGRDRRRGPLPLVALVLGLVLLAGACSSAGRAPAGGGELLPAVELPRLRGEGVVTRDDLVGTPTVINFWASWCPPCIDEMPGFEQVHRELGGRVQFVGVNREDARDAARRLADETGVTYLLVVDDDASYFRALGGRGMPTTVLVDAEGRIRHVFSGPLTPDQLRDRIATHLDVEVRASPD